MNYTEIRGYLEANNEPHLAPDELDHVAMCCHHIWKWYYEDRPLGSFLSAVVRNDLLEAIFKADDINAKALKLYAYFLTWEMPGDWRSKAIAEAKGI